MKKKSILALVLALMLTLCTLTACSQSTTPSESAAPGESQAADGETQGAQEPTAGASGKTRPTTNGKADNSLTVAISDPITTLDPELFKKQSEDNIIINVYDPLFYLDNDGNIVNALAEEYTVNDDGSVDVTLRAAKFHSGDDFKAEDVAYTLSHCTHSPLCSTLVGTMEVEVVDDSHIKLVFPKADQGYNFEALMPYIQGMNIINKSYCETVISDPDGDLGFNVDGTGAYKFVSKNENGDVVLERFADGWAPATIDTITFKYITGSAEIAFESGDLDMANYGATNFENIKTYDNVVAKDQFVNNLCFVTVNCVEGQPTADLRVRQAIAYCMNTEDLCSIASSDSGKPAYNIATPLIVDYADVADHFDVDVEKANALMTEAGYSESNKLPLTLIVSSSRTDWVSACEVLKEELEQSYFTINIEEISDTARFDNHDFDLGMIGIGLTSQFRSYEALFNLDTGLNMSGINDADVQAAFASMTDTASTQAAMKVATESLAYIPVYYSTTFYAYDADLNASDMNTQFSAFFYRDFSWNK